jgi:carboxylesterase type B
VKLLANSFQDSYATARRFATNGLLLTGGCTGSNWILCLRNKSAAELLLGYMLPHVWNMGQIPNYAGFEFPFVPIYGDQFMPISINSAMKSGNFANDKKMIIGHQEMEGAFFPIEFAQYDTGHRYLPFVPLALISNVNTCYNDIKNYFQNDTIGVPVAGNYTIGFTNPPSLSSVLFNPNPIRRAVIHVLGDYALVCPTVLFGALFAKNALQTDSVYQYRLTYPSSQSLCKTSLWANVTHSDELPLVFGQAFRPIERLLWTDSDRKISKVIMNVWTYFAING